MEARPSRFSSLAPTLGRLSALWVHHLELQMTRLTKQRRTAFLAQDGRCYYCAQPMWLNDCVAFAKRHGLSIKQARQFQCTAEHLRPRSAGGTLRLSNIAAACWYCNRHRGCRSDLASFRQRVQTRCSAGKWHSSFPAGAPNRSFKPNPPRNAIAPGIPR